MQSRANEAFSRVLIDKALEFSGWDLLDHHQVRFELNTATGRADYLLEGKRDPLRVLEAKREDVDPYDAVARGIHKQREVLLRQILNFRRTRNLLLPRLLSGQIENLLCPTA